MRFRKILVLARLVAGATAMVLPAAPLLLAAQPALAQENYVFSSINVTGNQRIEGETIRIFAGVPTGTAVSSTDLNAALDKLFSTGLFADASLVPDGATLIIRVVENPTVNKINFEGNNKIKDEVLSAAIEMQPRGPYSRAAAEQAAQVIADVYRAEGRYDATVRPLLIEQSDNRVDVVFEISEGAATGVSRINFIGNNAYSDRRLLGVITTTESGILRNLFSSDIFDAQQMQSDMDLLTDFYLERGFADFEIQSSVAELTRDRENFYITYDIYEGPAYTINSVSVSSTVNGLSPDGFTGQNLVQVGGLYSADDIAAAIEELENEVALRKFSFIQARPVLTRNDVAETIDVQFVLEQGPRVFVERIDITGNSATLDRVIRREFTLAEGDPFSARKIREAEEDIDALGYFAVVDVGVVPGSSENQAVVSVNAVDQSTGSISFGFTYSAEDGIGGSVILNERNFLGRGQRLNFELGIAQTRSVLAFGFTEPALLDRDLLAGFDVYYRDFDQTASSYQTTNIGLQPRISFPLSENGQLWLRYRLSSDEMRDFGPDVSPIIESEAGTLLTSAIGFTYDYGELNSSVSPTDGFNFVLNGDFAGLGGETNYTKAEISLTGYKSFFDEELVLSAELAGGALLWQNDAGSRAIDRFFLGGDSLRGFAYAGIGPRDKAGDVNDTLGGNYYGVARVQASFPIGLPAQYGVYGGVFLDAGSVSGLDNVEGGASGTIDDSPYLRVAAGVSLFWETPVGPLRFNFSRALRKREYDEVENFRFTVGTRF